VSANVRTKADQVANHGTKGSSCGDRCTDVKAATVGNRFSKRSESVFSWDSFSFEPRKMETSGGIKERLLLGYWWL